MDESPKQIKTCCKADCKVDYKQDNKGSANKRCGLGKHPIPADEQEEFYKQIIHSSYLISFFGLFLSWIIPYHFVFVKPYFQI